MGSQPASSSTYAPGLPLRAVSTSTPSILRTTLEGSCWDYPHFTELLSSSGSSPAALPQPPLLALLPPQSQGLELCPEPALRRWAALQFPRQPSARPCDEVSAGPSLFPPPAWRTLPARRACLLFRHCCPPTSLTFPTADHPLSLVLSQATTGEDRKFSAQELEKSLDSSSRCR